MDVEATTVGGRLGSPPPSVTGMIQAAQRGEKGAADELFAAVRHELRLRVRRRKRAGRGRVRQTTELLDDTFLRLLRTRQPWRNRAQFFAMATTTVRRLVLDAWKYERRSCRTAAAEAMVEVEALPAAGGAQAVCLDVNAAIAELTRLRPRWGRQAEARLFGGLNGHQIAELLHLTVHEAEADWAIARAWLQRRLEAHLER